MGLSGWPLRFAPAVVETEVLPQRPTGLLQRLSESCEPGLSFRVVRREWREHADAPHPLALLRVRANGHAAAAPPGVTNLRRFTVRSLACFQPKG